jgi:hypothetical protein
VCFMLRCVALHCAALRGASTQPAPRSDIQCNKGRRQLPRTLACSEWSSLLGARRAARCTASSSEPSLPTGWITCWPWRARSTWPAPGTGELERVGDSGERLSARLVAAPATPASPQNQAMHRQCTDKRTHTDATQDTQTATRTIAPPGSQVLCRELQGGNPQHLGGVGIPLPVDAPPDAPPAGAAGRARLRPGRPAQEVRGGGEGQ